jgi:hypothetical protein
MKTMAKLGAYLVKNINVTTNALWRRYYTNAIILQGKTQRTRPSGS